MSKHLNIRVVNPHNIKIGFTKHTEYEVRCQIPGVVELRRRRFYRYTDFVKFFDKMFEVIPHKEVKNLPPRPQKTYFGRFSRNNIEERIDYFNAILRILSCYPQVLLHREFQEFVGLYGYMTKELLVSHLKSLNGLESSSEEDEKYTKSRRSKKRLTFVLPQSVLTLFEKAQEEEARAKKRKKKNRESSSVNGKKNSDSSENDSEESEGEDESNEDSSEDTEEAEEEVLIKREVVKRLEEQKERLEEQTQTLNSFKKEFENKLRIFKGQREEFIAEKKEFEDTQSQKIQETIDEIKERKLEESKLRKQRMLDEVNRSRKRLKEEQLVLAQKEKQRTSDLVSIAISTNPPPISLNASNSTVDDLSVVVIEAIDILRFKRTISDLTKKLKHLPSEKLSNNSSEISENSGNDINEIIRSKSISSSYENNNIPIQNNGFIGVSSLVLEQREKQFQEIWEKKEKNLKSHKESLQTIHDSILDESNNLLETIKEIEVKKLQFQEESKRFNLEKDDFLMNMKLRANELESKRIQIEKNKKEVDEKSRNLRTSEEQFNQHKKSVQLEISKKQEGLDTSIADLSRARKELEISRDQVSLISDELSLKFLKLQKFLNLTDLKKQEIEKLQYTQESDLNELLSKKKIHEQREENLNARESRILKKVEFNKNWENTVKLEILRNKEKLEKSEKEYSKKLNSLKEEQKKHFSQRAELINSQLDLKKREKLGDKQTREFSSKLMEFEILQVEYQKNQEMLKTETSKFQEKELDFEKSKNQFSEDQEKFIKEKELFENEKLEFENSKEKILKLTSSSNILKKPNEPKIEEPKIEESKIEENSNNTSNVRKRKNRLTTRMTSVRYNQEQMELLKKEINNNSNNIDNTNKNESKDNLDNLDDLDGIDEEFDDDIDGLDDIVE